MDVKRNGDYFGVGIIRVDLGIISGAAHIPVHFLNGVEKDYTPPPPSTPRSRLFPTTETIHVAYMRRLLIPRANMAAFLDASFSICDLSDS